MTGDGKAGDGKAWKGDGMVLDNDFVVKLAVLGLHYHRCPFPIGWLINRGV